MNFPFFLAQVPGLGNAGTPAATPPPIRDIAPPVDVLPWPMWVVYTAVAVAAVILAVLIWLGIRWWRNRPVPPPPTPREIALARLQEARGRMQGLDPYAFSILVSDILREYVSAQFHLKATKQTSPEFLTSISDLPNFTGPEKKQLAEFLEKCDLIKFAHIAATTDDSSRLLDEAIRFVEGGAQ